MRYLKKLLAAIISLIIIISSTQISFLTIANALSNAENEIDESDTYSVGDIIEFGSYPQSQVTDENTISALNELISEEDWISYDYYSGNGNKGSMVQSDYMKYADVEYQGEKYRAVHFGAYRPIFVNDIANEEKSSQDDNGFLINAVYYFKYEPIEWIVVDPENGFVICKNVIDSQPFSNTLYLDDSKNEYLDSEKKIYANNYEYSSIRSWLNVQFYNVAFNGDEKNLIINSTIDTKSRDSSSDTYTGNDVNDNVFLPSFLELRCAGEGYFTDLNDSEDVTRQKVGSDYAKCQGLRSDSKGKSWWRLRTPGVASGNVYKVNAAGQLYSNAQISDTNDGIVPAMYLENINAESRSLKIDREKIYSDNTFVHYGSQMQYDSLFEYSNNGMTVYNCVENATRLSKVKKDNDCPTAAEYMMKITTSGDSWPSYGGYQQYIPKAEGGVFYHVIIAKIPKGYSIAYASNTLGINGGVECLTDRKGTGNWELYVFKVYYGLIFQNSPLYDSGLVYIKDNNTVGGKRINVKSELTWYVGYSNVFDNTGIKIYSEGNFATGSDYVCKYNNNQSTSDTVSISRVTTSADCPSTSGYMIQIKTDSGTTVPGLGGFFQQTKPESGMTYYHKFMAKVPVGYKLEYKSNYIDGNFQWVTGNEGTGEWKIYIYKLSVSKDAVKLGTFGFVALYPIDFDSGDEYSCGMEYFNEQSILSKDMRIWYLAYSNIFKLYEFNEDFKASDLVQGKSITYNSHNYIRYDYPVSWHMAKNLCERMGGHLATIISADENSAVKGLISSGSYYFLGGTDKVKEGSWKWLTGEPFDSKKYTNWNTEEPNNSGGTENYLAMRASDAKWNDLNESYRDGFICEFDNNYIPAKQVEKDGHIYSIYNERLSWTEAEAFCASRGGHLVSITSQEEQDLVLEMLDFGMDSCYWIGCTDVDKQGEWVWTSGEKFEYNNWSPGQPDHGSPNNDEHYGSIYNVETEYVKKTYWNDATNTRVDFGFICEVNTETINPDSSRCYNGNKYEIYDITLTWMDAKIYAEMKGGHLVTITTEAEQRCIESLISNSDLTRNYYYIGATNYNQLYKWNWVSDEEWNYTNWRVNQPDFSQATEFFGMIYSEKDFYGKWNDLTNSYNNIGFIIEYDDYYSTVSFDENNGAAVNYMTAPTVDDGWNLNNDKTLTKTVSGITITYDPSDETFTFDTDGKTIPYDADNRNQLLFSVELPQNVIENQYITTSAYSISGTMMTEKYSCPVIEIEGLEKNSLSPRCGVDIGKRDVDGIINNMIDDRYPVGPITKENADKAAVVAVWLYIPENGSIQFDNYKIKLSVNITDEKLEGSKYSKLTQKAIKGESFGDILNPPTRAGYDFTGWQYNGQPITPEDKPVNQFNQTIIAEWNAKTFKLTFNANGGVCELNSKDVLFGETYGELPVPTRSGYTFLGWYSKKKGGNLVKSSDIVNITANSTLYALWGRGDNQKCGDNLTWTLEGSTLIISGSGDMYDYPVGMSPWYDLNNNISKIVIEDGATSIGEKAFYGMTMSKSIEVPESVTEFGAGSFEMCINVSNIAISDAVTYIGENAFRNCNSLSEVYLPYNVTFVGEDCFEGCNSLNKITVINPHCQLPEIWITNNDNATVYGYGGSTAEAFAKDNDIKFVKLGEFGTLDGLDWMFDSATNILKISGKGNLPDFKSKNELPWKLFTYRATGIVIDEGITYIGDNSFVGFNNVQSLGMPKSLVNIGKNVFEDTLWFKNHEEGTVYVRSILYAYKGSLNTDSIVVGNGITAIAGNFSNSFINGGLSPESIQISSTVASVDDGALSFAKQLKTLYVNSGNKNYKTAGNVLYSKDGKQLICYPAGLDGNINLPESVTEIKPYAFAGCNALTSIKIGKNVTYIAENAFEESGLKTIYGYYGSYAQTYAEDNGYDFVPYTSTVTLDCNDDVGTIMKMTVNTGTAIGDLYVPGQIGFNFVGWYLETDADDVEISSDYVVDEDITLYAYWEEVPEEVPYITDISIVNQPSKMSYYVGDEIDSNGMKLSVRYSNGKTEEISSGYYCIPSKLNVAGTQKVTVTYAGLSTVYEVNVAKVIPVALSITKLPDTVSYFVGQKIQTKGLLATVKYNNGTQRLIKNSSEFEYIYDFSIASNASTVNINYQEDDVTVGTFYQVKVSDCPEIYAENIECNSGDEIILPVKIAGNTGLMGYMIYVTYDPEILTPSAPRTTIDGFIRSDIGVNEPGTLKVIWYNSSEYSKDGELFKIPFKINSKTESGEYNIGFSFSEEDTFNENFDNVLFECRDSKITVNSIESPTIYSDDMVAYPGDYLDIPVRFKNNIGISAGTLIKISYDFSAFDSYEIIENGKTSVMFSSEDKTNNSLMIFINSLKTTDENGLLFTIRLHISNKAYGKYEIKSLISDSKWKSDDNMVTVLEKEDVITIKGNNVVANSNETIIVPISVENNSGIMGYKIDAKYNQSILNFVSAICGDEWENGLFEFNESNGTISVIWSGNENNNADSIMFYLKFSVKNGVSSGTTNVYLSCDSDNTFNENYSTPTVYCYSSLVEINTKRYIVAVTDSFTQIDYSDKYVYNVATGLNNLDKYVTAIDGHSYTIEKISYNVGTGSQIIVSDSEKTVDIFTVVIFGDVNGDGWYDGMDAMIVSCLANGMLSKEDVGEDVYMAADCNHDGSIDQLDVDILQQAGVLLAQVDQSKSEEELLETSSAYVEYLNLIDQNVSVDENTTDNQIEEPTNNTTNVFAWLIDFIVKIFNYLKLHFAILK